MNFKSLSVGVLTTVLLFSGVGPSISYAQANDNDNKQVSSNFKANEKHQLKMSEKEFEKLAKKTDIQWHETVFEDGEVEYSLSDYEVREYLQETGQQDLLDKVDKENEDVIQTFASGVTTVKKNSYGGYDIYLSKLVVQTLAVGGSAAIGFLVALIPGVGWTLAGMILAAMSAHISTNIQNGKVFSFYSNFALRKVWSQ